MWWLQKICNFQLFTFVIIAWTILDLTRALQSGTANAVSGIDAGNNTHANCSDIQSSGQLYDVCGNDTYDEIPLNHQIFEFAQLFSVVNYKSKQINRFQL